MTSWSATFAPFGWRTARRPPIWRHRSNPWSRPSLQRRWATGTRTAGPSWPAKTRRSRCWTSRSCATWTRWALEGLGTLVELTTLFAVETPDLIERLADGIDTRDPALFGRSAHTLKGGAAQLGATRVAAIARELDRLGKAGSFDGAEKLLARLETAFGQTTAEFRGIADRIRPGSAPTVDDPGCARVPDEPNARDSRA